MLVSRTTSRKLVRSLLNLGSMLVLKKAAVCPLAATHICHKINQKLRLKDGLPYRCAQEKYEEGYGTVLDSGTTFTYLPSEAFSAFKEAVSSYALEHGLHSTKGPDPKVRLQGKPALPVEAAAGLWKMLNGPALAGASREVNSEICIAC